MIANLEALREQTARSSLTYHQGLQQWRTTEFSACVTPEPCFPFDPHRSLTLGFVDGDSAAFSNGDMVRVVCRVVGIKGADGLAIDYGDVNIVADVCHDLTVLGGDT